MSKGMTFTDPPASHRRTRRHNWEEITPLLRENPGRWLLFAEQEKVSVYNAIKGGKIKSIHPKDGYEVTSANNSPLTAKPRVADLYLRYNPEADENLTVKEKEAAMRAVRKAEKERKKEEQG